MKRGGLLLIERIARVLVLPGALWLGFSACWCAGPFARSQEPGAAASTLPGTAPASKPTEAGDAASLPVPPSPYRISGVVLDAVTRSPVPKATISAVPMTTVKRNRGTRRRRQTQSDPATGEAGADGRFDLSVPAAGGWEVTASARGYRTQALDEHDGYSTAVVLSDTAPAFRVTFHMTPASAIEGFVLDEGGEAVRGASVGLVYLPPPTPDNQHHRPVTRSQQMTDDRGFYKFGGLESGSYEVRVTAHPWYATASPRPGFFNEERLARPDTNEASAGADPLDVVYATVWFPGVTDPGTATPIVVHGGETQEANFCLLPVPGSHLRVAPPAGYGTGGAEGDRQPLPNTYLTKLLPDGTEDAQQTPARMDGRGNADIAGLSPGTYLVHQQLPSSATATLSTIQIGAGSPRFVDLGEGAPATIVTVEVDAGADMDSLQISFREVETGHTSFAQRLESAGRHIRRRAGQAQSDAAVAGPKEATRPERTVSLLPGKYEVFLNGAGDVHLAGIEATGATATGRVVTIGTGSPRLLLHTAAGRGTVTGVVRLHGQPLAGAMVMLIPATLGSPSGIDLPSRDQSNTDGSFEMANLLPGGYILVAIDHGWEINWSDASTLRRYLVHGMPLDIKPGEDLKEAIEAQAP